jgi:hypothetical protein
MRRAAIGIGVTADKSPDDIDPRVLAHLETIRDWRGQTFSDEELEYLASILEDGEIVSHMSYIRQVKLPSGSMKVKRPASEMWQARRHPILVVTERRIIVQLVSPSSVITGLKGEASSRALPLSKISEIDLKKSHGIRIRTSDGSKVTVSAGVGHRRKTYELLVATWKAV